MQPPDALLVAALRAAPRRYRMPPLPAHAGAAAARGPEAALAFAIEAARLGLLRGAPPTEEVRALFTRSLAGLIRDALGANGGDLAYQALVLQAQDAAVAEYVRLSAQLVADRRAVRAAVDAVAHPGKLRGMAESAARDALSRLHGLADADAWRELPPAIGQLLAAHDADGRLPPAPLRALLDNPALARLARGEALLALQAVQRWRALREQHGPLAGSAEAAARGRAAARVGQDAEQATVRALHGIAQLLQRRHGEAVAFRVVRSLRPPPGFPGEAGKAKDEWDAAIVQVASTGGAADVVLLAEVKASPAAATSDAARLHRGLLRLAHASADASYAFASADGPVPVAGASLRGLRPHGRALPPHVVYCCTAPAEAQPQVLNAASKAALFTEPACLAFAQQITRGAAPTHAELAPVWDALTTQPRLRSALHQFETAQAVREAMLHPQDLLAAAGQTLGALTAQHGFSR